MVAPPLPIRGRALVFFAFDVADAIDLPAVPAALRPERAPLVRSKPAPPSVAYAVPPVEVPLGARPVALGGTPREARVSARLFDFGAVSVSFAFELGGTLQDLPGFAQALARSELGAEAERVRDELVRELRSALHRPGPNDLVEDYAVFHLAQLGPRRPPAEREAEPPDTERLLREHAASLAGVLSMDAGPLSERHVAASLADPISYAPNDLLLAEWSAAVVVDDECDDTLAVLEFLNVQLVELRFLDARLDRALARFSSALQRQETPLGVLRGPHRGAIRALSELTVEASRLAERVENGLKLVPDVYLSRVHRRCAGRLGLAAWQHGLENKLEAVRHLTTILAERAAARRADLLELTIILLIALEIVLALAGGI